MKELRSLENIEFRLTPESRKIEGYALLFDKESVDFGGFTEIIDRNSLQGVLERSDILALLNHEDDKVLARSTNLKGTLSLEIDEKGLKYSFQCPNTPLGTEVYDAIQRGDLRNSSFAFSFADGGWKWEKRGGGYIRVITQFDKLFDVSPVFRPCYSDTTVALRSLQEFESTSTEIIEEIVDTPVEQIEQVEEVRINVTYDGNLYEIPYKVIEEQDNERKLNEYYEGLENSVQQLKK